MGSKTDRLTTNDARLLITQPYSALHRRCNGVHDGDAAVDLVGLQEDRCHRGHG